MSSPRGVGRGLNVKNVKIYGKGNRGGTGDARSGQRAGLGVEALGRWGGSPEQGRQHRKWKIIANCPGRFGEGHLHFVSRGKNRLNETLNFVIRWVSAGCTRRIRGGGENKGKREENRRKGGGEPREKKREKKRIKQEKKRSFSRGSSGEKSHLKWWFPGKGPWLGREEQGCCAKQPSAQKLGISF